MRQTVSSSSKPSEEFVALTGKLEGARPLVWPGLHNQRSRQQGIRAISQRATKPRINKRKLAVPQSLTWKGPS